MFRHFSSWFWLFLCTLSFFWGGSAKSQVTSDGTVNTQVNQNENVAAIAGGEVRGSNLFHSFQDFSVPNGNEAFFNNGTGIDNIFSRVTGGNISDINGAIRANGTASLFLVNPAGIVFGENARLDIGGSFYGSTASSILFEDGEFSTVDNLQQPVLSINAPIGLGFRDEPGDIVNRSTVQDSAEEVIGLEVNPGNNLTLVAGNLNFEGGVITASGGDIYLGAISESGRVEISENGSWSFAEDISRGDINLSNVPRVDVTGSGGGNIKIDVHNLNFDGGERDFGITAGIREESTNLEAQAGDITIDATGNISLLNGGLIFNITTGQGNAGAVNVTAAGNIIADGESPDRIASGITSRVFPDAVGNAGGVTVSTTNLNLTAGGRVDAGTDGIGNPGAVNVTATGDITIDGELSRGIPSGITSRISPSGVGNAGDVTVSTNNLNLTNGGRVDASTDGQGNAGAVNVTATGNITIDGERSLDTPLRGIPSGITSRINRDGVGNSGGVSVSTTNLNLTNGAIIDASTDGQGNAGAVNVTTTGDIAIDGEGSRGIPSGITSRINPAGVGNAGGVSVSTSNLNLTAGGRVDASTSGQGNAGAVNVAATGDITIDGERSLDTPLRGIPSGITSRINRDGKGNSGGVNVSTNNLTLTTGATIDASTAGQGNAGAVNVAATGDINIDGEGTRGIPSGITSRVDADLERDPEGVIVAVGNAGGVTVSTNNLTLTAGGHVSASTTGQGNANDVTIEASESITIIGFNESFRSGISANALNQDGNGGDVFITTGKLSVDDGGGIEATNFDDIGEQNSGTGRPGNINIVANSIALTDNARIETSTQFEEGESGIIDLQVADNITLDNNSFISAQAFGDANGGNLTIDSPFIVAFPSNGTGNDLVAAAAAGRGGNIELNVEQLFGLEAGNAINNNGGFISNNRNDIDVSGTLDDGNLQINTTRINPFQGATELPDKIVVPQERIQQACKANRELAAQSSFVVKGKGGVPSEPNLPLSSQILYSEGEIIVSENIPAIETSLGKIQPARGIVKDKSGIVKLTAYSTDNSGERNPVNSPNCDRV